MQDFSLIIFVVVSFLLGLISSFLILVGLARRWAKKRLDKEKNAFIAIASHYLLTPLSIIEGAISTIQEHETTFGLEERQEMHMRIKEGAERLLRIAEQMLLVVRLEDGELFINKTINSLANITHQAIYQLTRVANAKKISIRFIADPNNKFEGQFDSKTLLQAVEALVDNAIKFSEENSQIVVLVDEIQGENHYVIEVRDKGIGLTAEQLAQAKEKFYRGTAPYQFDYEGIGLGLYVADVIVKAHGGQLIIKSSGVHRGTIAQIVLPK